LRDQTRRSFDDFVEELGVRVPGITEMIILLVNHVVGEGLEMLMLFSRTKHFEGAEALAHTPRIATQRLVAALAEGELEQMWLRSDKIPCR